MLYPLSYEGGRGCKRTRVMVILCADLRRGSV
jgi:hypothetical protein